MRADSLASNFLQVMEDNDLDRPIEMGELLLIMTPTPYPGRCEQSWSSDNFVWRGDEI